MSFGNMEAFADAFADRDDILLELPWGKYLGRDSIRTCLLCDAGQDRHGILDIHCAVTECLEVAGDANTARGCWMFQSITTAKDGEAAGSGIRQTSALFPRAMTGKSGSSPFTPCLTPSLTKTGES